MKVILVGVLEIVVQERENFINSMVRVDFALVELAIVPMVRDIGIFGDSSMGGVGGWGGMVVFAEYYID